MRRFLVFTHEKTSLWLISAEVLGVQDFGDFPEVGVLPAKPVDERVCLEAKQSPDTVPFEFSNVRARCRFFFYDTGG